MGVIQWGMFRIPLYSAARGVLCCFILVPGQFHKHPGVALGLELPVDEQVPEGLEPQTAQEKELVAEISTHTKLRTYG